MDKFKDNISNLQPQLVSIILVTLILVILSIVIYVKVKKVRPNKAPKGIVLVTEQYVKGVDELFSSIAEEKINPVAPYIFTLLSFMIIGNLFGLVGFEPPTTSYSVTLILGLVAWVGIYVIGIIFQKWRYFLKFVNPLNVIGQFAPLISISFRLFGNMIGGSTLMYLIYAATGFLWGKIPYVGQFNLLGALIAPPLHIYFDLFDSLIQGFVFTLLTLVYWSLETDVPKKKTLIQNIEEEIAHPIG